MNYKMMGRFLAQILSIEGIFMIPAFCISFYCGDTPAAEAFLISMAVIGLLAVGLFLICRGPPALSTPRRASYAWESAGSY